MNDKTIYVVVARTPWAKVIMGPSRQAVFETHVLREAIDMKTTESGTNGVSVARLTHKAIARMAGYRVERSDTWTFQYFDKDDPLNVSGFVYISEAAAWEACCIDNGLIIVEGE